MGDVDPGAGVVATGYALRVFPGAINTASRRSTTQLNPYTYPQSTLSKSASTPGSKFGRRGDSDLTRRQQLTSKAFVGLSYCYWFLLFIKHKCKKSFAVSGAKKKIGYLRS